MSVAAVYLPNLSGTVRDLSLDESADRRCTLAPVWVTVMNGCCFRRVRVGRQRIEKVQSEEVVSGRLIFYVVRIFPKVRINHFRITITIHVGDRNPASSWKQTGKKLRREFGVASAARADPKRIRIRTIYVRAFQEPGPN